MFLGTGFLPTALPNESWDLVETPHLGPSVRWDERVDLGSQNILQFLDESRHVFGESLGELKMFKIKWTVLMLFFPVVLASCDLDSVGNSNERAMKQFENEDVVRFGVKGVFLELPNSNQLRPDGWRQVMPRSDAEPIRAIIAPDGARYIPLDEFLGYLDSSIVPSLKHFAFLRIQVYSLQYDQVFLKAYKTCREKISSDWVKSDFSEELLLMPDPNRDDPVSYNPMYTFRDSGAKLFGQEFCLTQNRIFDGDAGTRRNFEVMLSLAPEVTFELNVSISDADLHLLPEIIALMELKTREILVDGSL